MAVTTDASGAQKLALNVAGAIPRSELQNLSVIQGVQSVVPIPLYDTIAVANGNTAVSFTFFQNTQQGIFDPNTNIESKGQLISGKVEVVTEIVLDATVSVLSATTLADIVALTHAPATFTFTINGVAYAQGFIKDLIGGGLFATPAGTGSNAPYAYATPRSNAGSGFRLNPALVIPTQVGFGLTLNYPNGSAPNPTNTVYLRCTLRGQQVRLMSS
jgi:hypothetical protein